jgi:hypothetical protein
MTTTDSSFVAQGPAAVGFNAKPSPGPFNPGTPFKIGVTAIGQYAGISGTTDSFLVPPAQRLWANAGVLGSSFTNYGVSAAVEGVTGYSVIDNAVGGYSLNSIGVFGRSQATHGVFGLALHLNTATGSGVVGVAESAGSGLPAGYDQDAGVLGTSTGHPGVTGMSTMNAGVVGYSVNGIGVYAESAVEAGHFKGDVTVTGKLTVLGIKAAGVPFPDGSRRLLYCLESPDSWFEDFGSARLSRGRAVVKLDADFAKVVKLNECHVFLTPQGECRGLYVRRKGGRSFEVRELQGGRSSIRFSYRIVARRKDVPGERFAKVEPASPPLPKPPGRRGRSGGKRPSLDALVAKLRRRRAAYLTRGRKRSKRRA